MKKEVGMVVCMLLIGTVFSVSGTVDREDTFMSLVSGNTLYVGGSGPGNYSTIQAAIDDASDGDTIYVYDDSSPYCENIIVNKAINLIGEDRNTTEINGHLKGNVVIIRSDGVTVSGFLIMHSGEVYLDVGIQIWANDTIVSNNIIKENNIGIAVFSRHQYTLLNNVISNNIISSNSYFGIWLNFCKYTTVKNNIIIDTTERGIHTNYADHSTISGNHIENSKTGMSLYQESNTNEILDNTIINSEFHGLYLDESGYSKLSGNNIINNGFRGIWLRNSNNNNISRNNIENNSICGLTMEGAYSNTIVQNNFIDNGVFNVRFVLSYKKILERNKWDGNYWSESSTGFHMIHGRISFFGFIFGLLPWFCIDWHPSQDPYEIGI